MIINNHFIQICSVAYFSSDRERPVFSGLSSDFKTLCKDSGKVTLVSQMTDQRPPIVRDLLLLPVPQSSLLLDRHLENESKHTGPTSLLCPHLRMPHFPSQGVSCIIYS